LMAQLRFLKSSAGGRGVRLAAGLDAAGAAEPMAPCSQGGTGVGASTALAALAAALGATGSGSTSPADGSGSGTGAALPPLRGAGWAGGGGGGGGGGRVAPAPPPPPARAPAGAQRAGAHPRRNDEPALAGVRARLGARRRQTAAGSQRALGFLLRQILLQQLL